MLCKIWDVGKAFLERISSLLLCSFDKFVCFPPQTQNVVPATRSTLQSKMGKALSMKSFRTLQIFLFSDGSGSPGLEKSATWFVELVFPNQKKRAWSCLWQGIFSHDFGDIEAVFVFFNGAVTKVLFDGIACHCAANPGVSLCSVTDGDDMFGVLFRDRVEADDAAVEGLVELQVLPLRFNPCAQRGSRRAEGFKCL